ncbi:hypothetical protein IIA79_02605 [bacterium]|nr:hypothetical protein [bacterium]
MGVVIIYVPAQDVKSSDPDEDQGMQAPDEQLLIRLRRLATLLIPVYREVGCTCLLKKHHLLREPASSPQRSESPPPSTALPGSGLQTPETGHRAASLPLLAVLAPLTNALARTGYYDVALSAGELANECEPTDDLLLTRAYLLVALGEIEDACLIYREVLRRLGRIPVEEVGRLADLATSHASENDILALYREVKRHSAA